MPARARCSTRWLGATRPRWRSPTGLHAILCGPCRKPRSPSMTNSPMNAPAAADAIGPATPRSGWRWAPYWVLAFVALWPAPGIAEGVLVLGALAAIIKLATTRFRGGTELLSGPAWALTSALFFAYWLPQLLSAFDAIDAREA